LITDILNSQNSSLILLLAATTDYLIGDPKNWLHPVQIIGWGIDRGSKVIINYCHKSWQRRLGGIILGGSIILASSSIGWILVWWCHNINDWLGIIVEIILLASCFAGKSLRVAVKDVLGVLERDDLTEARSRLSFYVGRDTDKLSTAEIWRALLETVAENAVDGVTAPLFYAIAGALIPGVGSVPLALGYKAASTLDSMIGYRREPYTDLGWFSAKLEDILTWLPCRLSVLTLALYSGQPKQVLAICRRDAIEDPSPNSGWSECVYAAILNVQLGGKNTYGGVIKEKPLLGDRLEPISVAKIDRALQLTRYCFLSWLVIGYWLLVIGH
jgi:adenosylcobinamide-phosphate synthase